MLSKLEAFFQETEPEVEAISGEESDTQAFMKLMSIFNRVRYTRDILGYTEIYTEIYWDILDILRYTEIY